MLQKIEMIFFLTSQIASLHPTNSHRNCRGENPAMRAHDINPPPESSPEIMFFFFLIYRRQHGSLAGQGSANERSHRGQYH